ncbi:hypothetical protein [Maribacter sp. 2307UL18-2]|uniref:hypothetical protein n=1 Tax=Maribacter sp. 2307UL18-2 TaxID=3386274 RepID=UPI0039BCBFE9
MKQSLYLIRILVFIAFLISCEGNFDPSPENYILLKAPIGNCENGSDDLRNSDNIIVEFTWENSGTFDDGELFVFEKNMDELVVQKPIETATKKAEASLPRGIEYYWYVKSNSVETGKAVQSDSKEFVSEFVLSESTPFPVAITNSVATPDTFIVEWENHPEETNRDLSYRVYFSTRVEKDAEINYPDIVFDQPGTSYDSDDRLIREQPKTGLKAGDYFFKIDAIAKSGVQDLISSFYVRVNLLTDY